LNIKVLEEVGYDISDSVDENCFLEIYSKPQRIRLYIVFGILEETEFKTQTRKEISVNF